MLKREEIIIDISEQMYSPYGIASLLSGLTAPSRGTIMFGPYMDIPAGRWAVTLTGECTGICQADIATGLGRLILATQVWQGDQVVLSFDCPFPVSGAEIRLHAVETTFVRLDGISLSRTIDLKRERMFQIYDRMNLSLMLDRTSLVDKAIIELQSWDKDNIDYLVEYAMNNIHPQSKMVFLDIGSYFGLYSMSMARSNLFDRIVAFEADNLNYRQLSANLLMNDPRCVIETHFAAVSDEIGEVAFESSLHSLDGNRGGVGINLAGQVGDIDKSPIQRITIDSVLPITGRQIIIKIDVEGHEKEVLRGMISLLKSNECLLQVEIYNDIEQVANWMSEIGYRMIHQISHDFYFSNFGGVAS